MSHSAFCRCQYCKYLSFQSNTVRCCQFHDMERIDTKLEKIQNSKMCIWKMWVVQNGVNIPFLFDEAQKVRSEFYFCGFFALPTLMFSDNPSIQYTVTHYNFEGIYGEAL